MISQNNFYLYFCEPYLTKIESDTIIVLKAYETAIHDKEKINYDFTKLGLHYEDCKLNIE